MIQKRYQYYSSDGIKWTKWFNYEKDNSKIFQLQKKDKIQNKHLLNEFRLWQQ